MAIEPTNNDTVVLHYNFIEQSGAFRNSVSLGSTQVSLRFRENSLYEWAYGTIIPYLKKIDSPTSWTNFWDDTSTNLFKDGFSFPYIDNSALYEEVKYGKDYVDMSDKTTRDRLAEVYGAARVPALGPNLKAPLTPGMYVLVLRFQNRDASGAVIADSDYFTNSITFPVSSISYTSKLERNTLSLNKFSFTRASFQTLQRAYIDIKDVVYNAKTGTTTYRLAEEVYLENNNTSGTPTVFGNVTRTEPIRTFTEDNGAITNLELTEKYNGATSIILPFAQQYQIVVLVDMNFNEEDARMVAAETSPYNPFIGLPYGCATSVSNGSRNSFQSVFYLTPATSIPLPVPLVKAFTGRAIVSLPADHNIPFTGRPIHVFRVRVPDTSRDYTLTDAGVTIERIKTFVADEPLRSIHDTNTGRKKAVRYVYATGASTAPLYGPMSVVVTTR